MSAEQQWPPFDRDAAPKLYGNVNYNNAVDLAYVLLFAKNGMPVYLRCETLNYKGKWLLSDFNLYPDIDKTGLPGSAAQPGAK